MGMYFNQIERVALLKEIRVSQIFIYLAIYFITSFHVIYLYVGKDKKENGLLLRVQNKIMSVFI